MPNRLLAHGNILNIRQARFAVVTTNVLHILEGDGRHEAG